MGQRTLPTPDASSGGSAPGREVDLRLSDIPLHEVVELVSIDLPADELVPLLERGVMPGCRMCPVRWSPSGDPIVLVDGSLFAFRREMAGCICVRRATDQPH